MLFDRFDLEGKVAIVTGAGRGLGASMALSLAQAGAAVAAVARTEPEIQKTVEEIRKLGKTALAVPADVTDSGAVDRLVTHVARHLGSIDILLNNAGGEFGIHKALTDVNDHEWDRIVSTNLTGAFYCTRAAGRYMLARGWGRIINVSCIYGTRGSINHAAYAAAKGGLMQFSQALALEWAKQGVTVNVLGIGWFEDQPQVDLASTEQDQLKRAIPLQRFGRGLDLESAVVYLASDASRYYTGQSIWLDGGILCR